MLNEKEKAVLYLSTCGYISYKKQYKIVTELNIEKLITNFDEFLILVKDILSNNEINELKMGYDLTKFNNYVSNLESCNIMVVTVFSKNYPSLLKEIDSPPLVL